MQLSRVPAFWYQNSSSPNHDKVLPGRPSMNFYYSHREDTLATWFWRYGDSIAPVPDGNCALRAPKVTDCLLDLLEQHGDSLILDAKMPRPVSFSLKFPSLAMLFVRSFWTLILNFYDYAEGDFKIFELFLYPPRETNAIFLHPPVERLRIF